LSKPGHGLKLLKFQCGQTNILKVVIHVKKYNFTIK
jgi:hypothetical protein